MKSVARIFSVTVKHTATLLWALITGRDANAEDGNFSERVAGMRFLEVPFTGFYGLLLLINPSMEIKQNTALLGSGIVVIENDV